jgi:multidrug efflux pump subunit AcrA (membrane-fusion protein)
MQLKLKNIESNKDFFPLSGISSKRGKYYGLDRERSFFLRPTCWTLMCFFLIAGIWAACTEIDIVAVARGVVVNAQSEEGQDLEATSACNEGRGRRPYARESEKKATTNFTGASTDDFQRSKDVDPTSTSSPSISNEHLEIDAFVQDRDIGFVMPGQAVDIKMDAIPAARYGVIKGYLIDVHALKGGCCRDSCFVARISLPVDSVNLDQRKFHLMPRMKVTADIKIGARRVSDFILAPLFRLRSESLRER